MGRRDHEVEIRHPSGPPVADGDGEYVTPYDEVHARAFAAIEPATAQRLERFALAGVIAAATHLVTLPWIAGVTSKTRVLFEGRRLDVLGYSNTEERDIELVLICQEIVP